MDPFTPIHRIFWQKERIGILTNQLDAQLHKHWMQQVFIGIEDKVDLTVKEQAIRGRCIVVEKNIPHAFSARQLTLSLLIEPASTYASFLSTRMSEEGYWICDIDEMKALAQEFIILKQTDSITCYRECMKKLDTCLGFSTKDIVRDERILDFLYHLEHCNCDDHTIQKFAKEAALSTSRFTHLFKKEIGLPLKSYLLLHQMQCAFQLLSDGRSVSAAAMHAGFDSPSHFAGTVKRMMGLSASFALKNSKFLKVL